MDKKNQKIKFVNDEPVLIVETNGKRLLIISDLHLGIEGICGVKKIAEKMIEKNIEKIEYLIKKTNSSTLVINGDIKHHIPVAEEIGEKEEREVELWTKLLRENKNIEKEIEREVSRMIPSIIDRISKNCEVILLSGNHDGGLKRLSTIEGNFEIKKELILEKVGIFHGHRKPSNKLMKCEIIITGHLHPAIEFKDKLGYKFRKKVWVVGRFDEKEKPKVIIMPAFNEIIVGFPLSEDKRIIEQKLMGPIFRKTFKIEDVYLLNGTKVE